MQNTSTLGESASARRRSLGLRQDEVAQLAGCSTRFVHSLEHDKPRLALDKVLDVLEVLGLTLDVVPLTPERSRRVA
jgi:HTH-type transcriptional regulator / antitoxin HipB